VRMYMFVCMYVCIHGYVSVRVWVCLSVCLYLTSDTLHNVRRESARDDGDHTARGAICIYIFINTCIHTYIHTCISIFE